MSTNFVLGFGMRDAGKTMGLAPYGKPRYADILLDAIGLHSDGSYSFRVDKYGERPFLHSDSSLFRKVMPECRSPKEPLRQLHMDVAASLQHVTEVVALHCLEKLNAAHRYDHLCLAGGVALNSMLNGRILRTGAFKSVFVPPNPGDNGTSLGSALQAIGLCRLRCRPSDPYWGAGFTEEEYVSSLIQFGLQFTRHGDIETVAARLLAEGNIIGWFQGRAEAGPRALGNRSILADPRVASMKDRVNSQVKHREWFRPFAPVVPEEDAADWFETQAPSPFMSFVAPVLSQKQRLIPAVTHIDGTARLQTVNRKQNGRLYTLLKAFGTYTGIPVLLNTSFNVMGEPIVNSPADAIRSLLTTKLDYLVLGSLLIKRPQS